MELGKIEKGYLGSLIVEQKLIKNGFNVFKPVTENGKIDMIIEKNNKYFRLQIKTVITEKRNGVKNVPVRKLSHNKTSHKTHLYTAEEIDYFVGVDLDTEDVFMIPILFSQQYRSSISINKIQNFKNNFNLTEPYSRNIISGEDNIGETLTDNADGNTEGME